MVWKFHHLPERHESLSLWKYFLEALRQACLCFCTLCRNDEQSLQSPRTLGTTTQNKESDNTSFLIRVEWSWVFKLSSLKTAAHLVLTNTLVISSYMKQCLLKDSCASCLIILMNLHLCSLCLHQKCDFVTSLTIPRRSASVAKMSPILAASLELMWIPECFKTEKFLVSLHFWFHYSDVFISSKHSADPTRTWEYTALSKEHSNNLITKCFCFTEKSASLFFRIVSVKSVNSS